MSGDYCHVIDHAFLAAPAQTFMGQRVNTYLECPPLQTLQEAGDRVLAVRPYVHNDHYWQVYFDTNRIIRETFGEAKFPVPEQHVALRNVS